MLVKTQKLIRRMKIVLFMAGMILFGKQTVFSQCPRYDQFMNRGNALLKEGRADEALTEFQAAQIAARECGLSTDPPAAALQQVFNVLKAQRDNAVRTQQLATAAQAEALQQKAIANQEAEEAIKAKKQAVEAQAIAEKARIEADTARAIAVSERTKTEAALLKAAKLIDAFYFYNDQLALAFKGNKYGFINKEAQVRIPYKYDQALPFNEITGLASVSINNIEYLIDTSGHEFLMVVDADLINARTESVDLSNFRLKKLPQTLSACKDLKFLWLFGNRLNKSKISDLGLRELRQLDISANTMKEVPNWVLSLPKLEYLNLRSNALSDANSCSKLASLKVLDLSYNQIKDFPADISTLENLHRLDLSNNFLFSLPPQACTLHQLSTLLLNNNKITYFPECLHHLTALRYLEANLNRLDVLPDSLGLLQKLEILSLSFNRLKELPDSFSNLTELKFLDLSYNQLTEVPVSIRTLKNLREINFAGNQLTSLPEWLADLPQLQNVYVSGNPIAEISAVLKNIVQK